MSGAASLGSTRSEDLYGFGDSHTEVEGVEDAVAVLK